MKSIIISAALALCVASTLLAATPNVHAAAFNTSQMQNQQYLRRAGILGLHIPFTRPQFLNQFTRAGALPRGTSPSTNWAWANPLPNGDQFGAVAAGNGVYVAVGGDGVIYSSTDGINWSADSTGLANGSFMDDVIYAGGQFVAIGQSVILETSTNTGFVSLTSTDGVHWTQTNLSSLFPSNSEFANNLGYGNNIYLAVNTVALTSTDGRTWTLHTIDSGNGITFAAPVFGASKFVSFGVNSSNGYVIYYSADNGSTWLAATVTVPSGDSLYSVAWNGSVFVATGIDANTAVCGSNCGLLFTSSDGITWTQQPDVSGPYLEAVTVAGNTFYGDNGGNQLTSTNGTTWIVGSNEVNRPPYGFSGFVHSVIYTGTEFMGTGSSPLQLVTSPDFANWTDITLAHGSIADLNNVIFVSNQFVAIGHQYDPANGNDDAVVLTSPNGIIWTTVYTSTTTIYENAIAWNGSTYVIVGDDSNLISPDAIHWITQTTTTDLNDVTYGNGKFVAVGPNGEMETSPDGVTWTNQTSGTTSWISSVTWTGSLFVAVTNNPNVGSTDGTNILTSPDGITWTSASLTAPTGQLFGFWRVRWTGTELLAVGGNYSTATGTVNNPLLATSSNGSAWTVNELPTSVFGAHPLGDIVSYNGEYIASGNSPGASFGGNMYSSTDGINWTFLPTPFAYSDVLAANGARLIAVGLNGNIIYTGDTAPVAIDGSLTLTGDSSGTGTLTATDAENDPLTYSVVSTPSHGTVTVTDAATGAFTYTPTSGYAGTDSFTFKANDGQLDSNTATESITVNAVAPTASNGNVTTTEGTAVNGTLSASGTSSLTFAVVTQPAHGTVILTNASTGAFTYTSASGYTGTDSFTFNASNSVGTSNTATESITVNAVAPTASNGNVTTTEGTAVNGTLTATGTGPLTYATVAQPGHGTVSITNTATGAFTYTPASGYTGTDSFTFNASNSGGTSNTATESVTVTAPIPPAPVATNGSVTTTAGMAVNGTLAATGTGPLTYAIVAQPGHGAVSITNTATGAFTYTPTSGYTGTDSFMFDASNSGGTSNTAAESITVTASNSGGGGGGSTGGGSGGGGGFGFFGLLALVSAETLRRRYRNH